MTPFKHTHMTIIVVRFRGKERRKDNTNTDRRIKEERIDTKRDTQTDNRWTDRWSGRWTG